MGAKRKAAALPGVSPPQDRAAQILAAALAQVSQAERLRLPTLAPVVADGIIEAVLPWPPSNNTYYRRVGHKTLISERGREYRKSVGELAARHRLPKARGRLAVEVDAHPPDSRMRDLDNLWKGLLDSLVHAGVIEDDSHIDDLRIRRRGLDRPAGSVMVRITTIVEEASGGGR